MEPSLRHRLGPIAGIVTLAVGLGLVVVVRSVAAFFGADVPDHEINHVAIIIARQAENPSPASPMTLELSCYDSRILPIWKPLKDDKTFKNWTSDYVGLHDCASMLELREIDLNNDGEKEVIARGKAEPLCGDGWRGCGVWVFSSKVDRHRVLLSRTEGSDAALEQLVSPKTTRGYRDLVVRFWGPNASERLATYSYNGRDYVESSCVYRVHSEEKNGPRKLVPCVDY